jgi:hypothetical protein
LRGLDPRAPQLNAFPSLDARFQVGGNPSNPIVPVTALTSAPPNTSPVADAGEDQDALVGHEVQLDGSASYDDDGDVLDYHWTLVGPSESTATLSGDDSAFPTFVPDLPGVYEISLVVDDGQASSASDSVLVHVITAAELAEDLIAEAHDIVTGLGSAELSTPGHGRSFERHLEQALEALALGLFGDAIAKLEWALVRTDGCALNGLPDRRNGPGADWITTCEAQAPIYDALVAALDALSE